MLGLFRNCLAILGLVLLTAGTLQAQSRPVYHHPFLYEAWEAYRFCEVPLRELKHKHVKKMLDQLKLISGRDLRVEKVGKSVEGRPIFLVRFGKGPTNVLMWSQMHGNEPTATAALMDIFHFLVRQKEHPFVRTIRDSLTLLAVPMLNPDGAERFVRRNVQGLDINRDARDLQTPEGRVLYELQRKYRPDFAFNLHDQNARRTAGRTNRLVAIALLAPPFDWEANDNSVRIRAKKLVSVIYEALGPYLYGHLARYDAEYMPRAFGDAMQRWGASTVLIESGGWFKDRDPFLQRMNFVAILSALHAIATGSVDEANPAVYDALPVNDKPLYDLLVLDARVYNGALQKPFRADVGVNFDFPKGGSRSEKRATFADLGDLDIFAGKDTLQVRDPVLAPGLVACLKKIPASVEELEASLQNGCRQGFTTFFLPVRLSRFAEDFPGLLALKDVSFPVNLGAFLLLDAPVRTAADSLALLRALSMRFPFVAIRDSSASVIRLLEGLKQAWVVESRLPWLNEKFEDFSKRVIAHAEHAAALVGLRKRGKITPGAVADFLIGREVKAGRVEVRQLFVNGHLIWEHGQWRDAPPGARWWPLMDDHLEKEGEK
jgi:hypothetical protein